MPRLVCLRISDEEPAQLQLLLELKKKAEDLLVVLRRSVVVTHRDQRDVLLEAHS